MLCSEKKGEEMSLGGVGDKFEECEHAQQATCKS